MKTEIDLPEEVRKSLSAVIAEYTDKGWSNFEIHRPTASSDPDPGPRVRMNATSPDGERVHEGFDECEDLAQSVEAFLSSQSR